MGKKLATYLFLFLPGLLLYAQKNLPKNSLEVNNLKAKVKVQIARLYKLKKQADQTETVQWDYTDTNYYNRAGNLTLSVSHGEDSKEDTREVYTYDSTGRYLRHYISYNSNNQATEESFFIYDLAGNELEQKEVDWEAGLTVIDRYTYNTAGKCIKIQSCAINEADTTSETFVPDEVVVNTYDNENRMIKRDYYDGNNQLKYYFTYEFDANGNQTMFNSEQNGYVKYVLHANGNLLSSQRITSEKNVTYSAFYTYDKRDNRTSFKEYDREGDLIRETRHVFEQFDKRGNWLRATFLVDNKLSGYEVRSFTYYKR